ncbi:hypothetical protein CFP56_010135 [Quercus suber]|uniref:Uncharacterized protein n=1 Tax=Quercus suber TaxID=58331 RepID=A0AAW0L184_QUESU
MSKNFSKSFAYDCTGLSLLQSHPQKLYSSTGGAPDHLAPWIPPGRPSSISARFTGNIVITGNVYEGNEGTTNNDPCQRFQETH